MKIKKTSKEWVKKYKKLIKILDPDGWDRQNYDYSFNKEKITFEKFQMRCSISTCSFDNKFWDIGR